MTLYYVPLKERFIRVGKSSWSQFNKYMELDKIGFLLQYNKEDEEKIKDPNFIRRHLVCVKSTHTYIEADSREEVKSIFEKEWEGAKVGIKAKALWIYQRYRRIRKIPECDIRHKNKRNEFTCGEPIHNIKDHEDKDSDGWNMNGEYGMCVLEGYDTPDGCPCK